LSRAERISDRLPRFYKNWDRTSLVSAFVQSVCEQLNESEQGITRLLKAHWVETAKSEELERIAVLVRSSHLPHEDDEHFRGRLKRAVDEYKGGGTVSVILDEVKKLVGAKPGEIEIVENPVTEKMAEFSVIANNTWTLGSFSIEDEQPSLTLTVKEEGEVSNPEIRNIDTGLSVTYEGTLKGGEQLTIDQDRALLDEKDVTKRVKMRGPLRLLRKGSVWKYSEALLENIGLFDTAKFDDHTFSVDVPAVSIRFDWKRRQPATFMVMVKSESLARSSLSGSDLEKVLNSRRAVGINVIVKVME
jgi:hypothetical protein